MGSFGRINGGTMNKQFWKDFYGWLDRATDEGLDFALEEAKAKLSNCADRDLAGDIRRMIRAIEEEKISRWEIERFQQR
ncbi:MAG: hypothetical protein DI596_06110 [Azospira oryzae]|nr:MAG: hypothetical protein DI596_06110 [Azospira oryzae]PZP80583.1 MAG: hypothetical protein DI593_06110 [Azospira oryzae]